MREINATQRPFELVVNSGLPPIRTGSSAGDDGVEQAYMQPATEPFTIDQAQWTSGLRRRASYAYTRTEDITTDQRLSNAPERLGLLGRELTFGHDKSFARVELQATSERLRVGETTLGPVWRFNATWSSQKLVKGLELSAASTTCSTKITATGCRGISRRTPSNWTDGNSASRRLTNFDMLFCHSSTKPRLALNGNAGLRRWPFVCVALLFLLPTLSLSGRQSGEYEVKAAFLLNFAKFVEWPSKAFPDSNAPFVIGVVGADPFGDALLQIVKGQTAHRRPLEIRRFKVAEDFGGCHILFLSRSLASQTDHVLKRLEGRPVLTVSEKEDFVRQGGVIGFASVDKSVRFDINVKAAEAVNLKVSSKLLAVAREVLQSL